jgi:hypothetical protein
VAAQVTSLIKHVDTAPPELTLKKPHCPWPEHCGSEHVCEAISHTAVLELQNRHTPQSLSDAHRLDDGPVAIKMPMLDAHGVLAGPLDPK